MLDVQAIKEDATAVGKAIVEAPGKIVSFLHELASLPDHCWHLSIIGLGSLLATHGQKELGESLVAAGLAMFKGSGK